MRVWCNQFILFYKRNRLQKNKYNVMVKVSEKFQSGLHNYERSDFNLGYRTDC